MKQEASLVELQSIQASQVDMKFLSVAAIFVAFFQVKISLVHSKETTLQTAFANIVEALAQRNHVMAIVANGFFKWYSSILATSSGYPHVVAKFDGLGDFILNSSAIVFLNSTVALEAFNNRTFLPKTSTISQYPIFIHCQGLTVNEIANIKVFRNEMPLILYEYFVIEEHNLIRLLTVGYYSPRKCK